MTEEENVYDYKSMEKMSLHDILEYIKQIGNYDVAMIYGEGVGCDDLDVERNKRNLKISFKPVGYLGEIMVLLLGSLEEIRNFRIADHNEYRNLDNPPSEIRSLDSGMYFWGTEDSVDNFYKEGYKILQNQEKGK